MTSLALMAALVVGQQFNGSGLCQVDVGYSVGIPGQTGLFSVTPPARNYWRNVWVDDHGYTPGYIGVTNLVAWPKQGAQVGWLWRIQADDGYWACSAAGTWEVLEWDDEVFYFIQYNVIAVWHGDPE